MKTFNQWIVAGAAVVFLGLGATQALAQRQGGGNFDPAQMQQRMMDRYKEQLEVKSDDEWKIISERVTKVMDARRNLGGGNLFGRRTGGGPGGATGTNDPSADNQNQNRRNRGGGIFGPTEPDPAAEALQKAIDAKAPAEEIKAKLAAYRASRKDKQAKLDKAQDELRQVLSLRQEGMAVLAGLLQ